MKTGWLIALSFCCMTGQPAHALWSDLTEKCSPRTFLKQLEQPKIKMTESDLEYDLNQLFPDQKWKRDWLARLYAPEIKKGIYYLNIDRASIRSSLFLPRLPFHIAKSLIESAREVGLSKAERYLIMPGKALGAIAIANPYSSLFTILAFGPGNRLLQMVHLQYRDAVSEFDPSTLKANEVFVIGITAKDELRSGLVGKTAAVSIWNEARELQNQFPDQVVIFDLSQSSDSQVDKSVRQLRSDLSLKGLKIATLAIQGHAAPGVLGGETDSTSGPVEAFAKVLAPLNNSFSNDPNIVFNGCNLARGDYAKLELQDFAKRMKLSKLKITANTEFGISTQAVEGYKTRYIYLMPHFWLFAPALRPVNALVARTFYGGESVPEVISTAGRYTYQYSHSDKKD